MQFKRLTNAELESLQADFIKFLAVNGIDAESWQSIKKNNTKHTEELIENFSDLVYSTSLENIKYLMKIENNFFFLFVMEEDQGILHVFNIKESINEVADITHKSVAYVSSDQKPYSLARKMEIFNLMESGCSICSENIYISFENLMN